MHTGNELLFMGCQLLHCRWRGDVYQNVIGLQRMDDSFPMPEYVCWGLYNKQLCRVWCLYWNWDDSHIV
jgi:hypothetical protein